MTHRPHVMLSRVFVYRTDRRTGTSIRPGPGGSISLTCSGLSCQCEGGSVRGNLGVFDSAISVLHSHANRVIQVGQVIGIGVRHFGAIVEALDNARGTRVVLKTAHWR